MSARQIIGVLPGEGWVIERIEADGSKTVLPLPGFAVLADGEIWPLPLSLPAEWSWRPSNGSQDDGYVKRSAARLAQQPLTGPFGPLVNPDLDDETTNPEPTWWRR